jgi:hypothetical protein
MRMRWDKLDLVDAARLMRTKRRRPPRPVVSAGLHWRHAAGSQLAGQPTWPLPALRSPLAGSGVAHR